MTVPRSLSLLFAAAVALLGACAGGDDRALDDGTDGPGSAAWDSDDVSCTDTAECAAGEVCEGGVCQMQRCMETYDSTAPLGAARFFGIDAELAIVGDGAYVDGFEAVGESYLGSWELGIDIVDITGGNFDGSRPHGVAVAEAFTDVVRVTQGGKELTLGIGIWPRALAAGDVDADGLDELVALGEDGTIAVCHVDEGTCYVGEIDNSEGGDVAVGDVDGDGYAEPLFLLRYGGETTVVIWNTDADLTGQEPAIGWEFNFPMKSIAAGDLDGDLVDEMVGLEDGGYWGIANDKLHVFSPASGQLVLKQDVYGHSADVAVGDRDSDDADEVALLREDHKFELLELSAGPSLSSMAVMNISVGQSASRVTMVDWDGDSAAGRLVGGPELVAGEVVPISVVVLPPYEAGASDGVSSVLIGSTDIESETYSDTVGLQLGLTVGFGADIGGIFKAKVNGYIRDSYSVTHATSTSRVVGGRYSFSADPELYGDDYAVVITSCGCFHRYRYETEDPANKLGGSGKPMEFFVPVGGQTLIYSSKRYNALARALGTLPEVSVMSRIGATDTYFGEPRTLAGGAIAPEDYLFTNLPLFQVSDVAEVGFWLTSSEYEVNGSAQTTTLGASGTLGLFGADVTVDASASVGSAYEIRVGQEAIFAGRVPPLPDHPDTPEDEFEAFRYAYSPYVYREHYVDAAGQDAAYYVVNYTASR